MYAFDRQTDGRTDGRTVGRTDRRTDSFLIAIPRPHSMQRGKNRANLLCQMVKYLYSVSQKNIPDIFSCNSRKHCRIFIIFGTHVTKKVSNQQML